MDLEKMQQVRGVLDRMLRNEEAANFLAGMNPVQSACTKAIELVDPAHHELSRIVDARKKALVDELRGLGMAHLAAPAPPPSKTPALDAAKAAAASPELERARATLRDDTDVCAEARRTPA